MIVHFKVVIPAEPVGNVIVEVGEAGELMVTPAPLTTDQAPVSPEPGVLPERLTVPGQVAAILAPALATVAGNVVKTTS